MSYSADTGPGVVNTNTVPIASFTGIKDILFGGTGTGYGIYVLLAIVLFALWFFFMRA
jgi:hypothetical protein